VELEDRMKQERRREAIEDAIEPAPADPFALDPMRLVRDAVTVQSQRALAMAREAGLETP